MPAKFAKISRPQIAQAYPRQRLFVLLDEVQARPITWISANAGAGKTVLVASYLAVRQLPALWYRLDNRDADAATFFYYLREAALHAGLPQADALPLLTAEYVGVEAEFAQNFFAKLFAEVSGPYALVFDNFQDLPDDAPLHAMLSQALQELTQNVRVFILSRSAPPASFARWQANQNMTVIDTKVMQLDREETSGLLAMQSQISIHHDVVELIHRETGGWAAGVILFFEYINRSGREDLDIRNVSREAMFHYFASELFKDVSDEMRQFLCWTALIPQFTLESAHELTGMANVEELVGELVNRNYFIYWQEGTDASTTYQFHPLFHAFLQIASRQRWNQQELKEAYAQAAQVLLHYDWLDEAVELLLKTDNVQAMITLILQHAQEMLAQGRYRTLNQWIENLGEQAINAQPWLRYWLASSKLPVDLILARQFYEQAYAAFRGTGDIQGTILSWAGVVQTYHLQWGSFAPLDYWIAEIDKLMPEIPGDLPIEIEWQLAGGMFVSLMYHQPDHPDMEAWVERVQQLIARDADANRRLDLASKLLLYYTWIGDLDAAEILVNTVSKLAAMAAPLPAMLWLGVQAVFHWFSADFGRAIDDVTQTLNLIKKHGMLGLQFFALGQGGYATLSQGKLDEADVYLKQMQNLMPPDSVLHQAHYHYLASWKAYLEGELQQAGWHVQIAAKALSDSETPFPYALNLIAHAHIDIAQGRDSDAVRCLEQVAVIARGMGSRFLEMRVAMLRAEIAMLREDELQLQRELALAFDIANRHGYINFDWWIPLSMSRLCAEALRLNIKPDYARMLIRHRDLTPDTHGMIADAWPWPLRIYTLGRFSVELDGKVMAFTGKAQKRPLELLKLVIAFGGRNVTEEAISEALWPEADGDAAHSTFTTTLSRLRKLLGNDVLQFSDGKLTLNNARCWVDVWACERLLGQLERAVHKQIQIPDMDKQLQRLQGYYHGSFLQGEGQGWILSLRERLKSRVLRILNLLVQQETDCNRAVSLYDFALQIDDLAEQAYQGLMTCLGAQGRYAEALAVYGRCRNLLHAKFGIEPSAKTRQLAASIQAGDESNLSHACGVCRRHHG